MKNFMRVCVLAVAAIHGQAFSQNAFQLNLGGASGVETIQNSMIISGNGVSATVKSWSVSRTGSTSTLVQSEVVQWAPGLGSKNSSETITTVPYVPYYVDNEDHYDFILFIFDKKVDVSSVSLSPSGNSFDTDATYWFGNIASDLDLTGKGLHELSSLGFGSAINSDATASNVSRTFSLSAPSGGVNALLLGARVAGDSEIDRFKIASVGGNSFTAVPETSTTMLAGFAFSLALLRRKRKAVS